MIRIVNADGKAEYELLAKHKSRSAEIGKEVDAAVREILDEIRRGGISAVNRYSEKFDRAAVREITKDELYDAVRGCSDELVSALRKSAKNIREYHERIGAPSWEWSPEAGVVLGQLTTAIERVGVYVPGGTAAYPSTVLMNVIPAKVAGVSEVIMVTPPTRNLNTAVLAAASIAGVDRVFAVGGVQAIAALAYGAGDIPRVDKIVGPGNAYVASAKRMVYGQVDIDMIAGPSEILIIADQGAVPEYAAADLLSQAEHDVQASAILITTDADFARRVTQETERQAGMLPRRKIIEQSLADFGAAIVVPTLDAACDLANRIAPEHLELMVRNPKDLLQSIRNAGAVFLGEYSPEALGDYMAGPCHVLPTSGTARFFSPLSTDSFLKKTSIISYDKSALARISDGIMAIAEAEGLEAHRNSIAVRGESAL